MAFYDLFVLHCTVHWTVKYCVLHSALNSVVLCTALHSSLNSVVLCTTLHCPDRDFHKPILKRLPGQPAAGNWQQHNILYSSLRQFGSTTDFVSYLVGFLIHLSPYFQNCFCFPICRYRNHVCKILTVRDPLIVKNLKIFPNVVFDSSN